MLCKLYDLQFEMNIRSLKAPKRKGGTLIAHHSSGFPPNFRAAYAPTVLWRNFMNVVIADSCHPDLYFYFQRWRRETS